MLDCISEESSAYVGLVGTGEAMKNEQRKLLDLTNSAGYLLQIAAERLVEETKQETGWGVLSHEWPWRDPMTSESGFLDLVLRHSALVVARVVVECKRVRVTKGHTCEWVFLVPHDAQEHSRLMCYGITEGASQSLSAAWEDFPIEPASVESEYCVIRGSGDPHDQYLERIIRRHLRAIECLSDEEANFPQRWAAGRDRIYLPMVLTTARLICCRLRPQDIQIEGGILTEDKATFEEVPYLRFRKTLAVNDPRRHQAQLPEWESCNVRSVLLVNGSHLGTLLRKLTVGSVGPNHPWNRPRVARP